MKLCLFRADYDFQGRFQALQIHRQWADHGREKQGQRASEQQQHTFQHQRVFAKHRVKATFSSHVCNLLLFWRNTSWLTWDRLTMLRNDNFGTQGQTNGCLCWWSSFVKLWCLGGQLRLISYAKTKRNRRTGERPVGLPLWQLSRLLMPLPGLKGPLKLA